jgi:hypothetical protein
VAKDDGTVLAAVVGPLAVELGRIVAKIPEASTTPGTRKMFETSANTVKSHPLPGGFLL